MEEQRIIWRCTSHKPLHRMNLFRAINTRLEREDDMKLTMFSFVGCCLGFCASSVSMTMSSGWYPNRSSMFINSLAL